MPKSVEEFDIGLQPTVAACARAVLEYKRRCERDNLPAVPSPPIEMG